MSGGVRLAAVVGQCLRPVCDRVLDDVGSSFRLPGASGPATTWKLKTCELVGVDQPARTATTDLTAVRTHVERPGEAAGRWDGSGDRSGLSHLLAKGAVSSSDGDATSRVREGEAYYRCARAGSSRHAANVLWPVRTGFGVVELVVRSPGRGRSCVPVRSYDHALHSSSRRQPSLDRGGCARTCSSRWNCDA